MRLDALATQPASGVASSNSTHYSAWPYHYIRGNEAEKALRYAQLAAEQAVCRRTQIADKGLRFDERFVRGSIRIATVLR